MRRLIIVLAVALTAALAPASADAALFFLFDRPTAAPNDRVTVRTGETPRNFRPTTRARVGKPIRLYLVRSDLTSDVHSRFDSRLEFIGAFRRDTHGRGTLTFSVPPLDAGRYDIASWCPDCAKYSRGRTFVVQDGAKFVGAYRSEAVLRIAWPETCAVTVPNGGPRILGPGRWYGNGFLWTTLPLDGVVRGRLEPDGSLFWKFGWLPLGPTGDLIVSGRRLDARSDPVHVLGVNWGYSSTGRGGWASAVRFPAPGCWKIRGRVRDISLSYVISVSAP
jgi:hypothetical protein